MINKKYKINQILFFLTIITILFISTILIGCTENEIQGEGIIQYNDLEGGFYGIIDDNGEKYDPINLPDEFKQDGIQVKYKLKIIENQMNTHMWGTIVEIIEIKKL